MPSVMMKLKSSKLLRSHFQDYLKSCKMPGLYDFIVNPPRSSDMVAIFDGTKKVGFPIPKQFTDAFKKVRGAPNPKLLDILHDYMKKRLDEEYNNGFQGSPYQAKYFVESSKIILGRVKWDKLYRAINASSAQIKALKGAAKSSLENMIKYLYDGDRNNAKREADRVLKALATVTKNNFSALKSSDFFKLIDDEVKKQGVFVPV